jgi:hypothetical protein
MSWMQRARHAPRCGCRGSMTVAACMSIPFHEDSSAFVSPAKFSTPAGVFQNRMGWVICQSASSAIMSASRVRSAGVRSARMNQPACAARAAHRLPCQ